MNLRIIIVFTLTLLMSSVFAQEKNNYKTETSIHYYNIDIMNGDEYMQQILIKLPLF